MSNAFTATRIISKSDPLVAQLLKDFRWQENGKKFVARIRGAGKFQSAVHSAQEENVLLEFSPSSEWTRPNIFFRWFLALRLPYLSVSIFPLLLVLFSYWKNTTMFFGWELSGIVVIATSLLHIGCNLWDDYEDHLRGVDSPESEGGSGVIRKLWIPAIHIRNAAAGFFLLGLLLGIFILLQLPWENSGRYLLGVGLLGSFLAASYSGWPFHYKYIAMGEPLVFFLGGPIIALGATSIFFQSAEPMLRLCLISLPLSFLVVLRLHLGNMQRIPFDTMAKSLTIANLVGFSISKKLTMFLFASPFLVIACLYIFHFINLHQILFPLLSLLTLPTAYLELNNTKGPLDPACREVRTQALWFHVSFASLYVISFLF